MSYKIVLIGAGSANFGLGTLGDLLSSPWLEGSEICLHDINPEALKRNEDFGHKFIAARKLPFKLTATTYRPAALEKADFCIISIEVGNRFKLWEQDWMVPLEFGIRQVYGENGGPGGLFHSLRIIPPILDICSDIMKFCPEAWVFNFSNPMSRICTTVMRKFPELKLVGLCHEVESLPAHLPHILNLPLERLRFQAGGLNHFSILTEVHDAATGEDLYPQVRLNAPAYFEQQVDILDWARVGMDPATAATFKHKPWTERGLFKVILEKFGYLPITSDSHFGEYIPWAYDVADLPGILDFYRAYVHWTSQQVSEAALIEGKGEGWGLLKIIEALVSGQPHHEPAVNILNHGLIEMLPRDIVVEVPAEIAGGGMKGVALPNYPRPIGGLLLNQYAVHDLTAEAVLRQSKAAALQALLVDPVVTSVRAAEQTLEAMLAMQSRWLGYLK